MCTVSMVGDYWKDRLPEQYPNVPWKYYSITNDMSQYITRAEFEQLKNEIKELKKLLLAAKEYDKNTNQPDCEVDEKIALLKKVAEMVGIDMKDVFP